MKRQSLAGLFFSLACLAAGPAPAQDTAIETAAKTSAPVSTSDQIAAYLADSPTTTLPPDKAAGAIVATPREMHGEVSVSVGTNGYRSVYGRTDMPIGETGRLSIAVQDTRGRGYGGYGRGYGWDGGRSLGASLAIGDGTSDRRDGLCRGSRFGDFRRDDIGSGQQACPRPPIDSY